MSTKRRMVYYNTVIKIKELKLWFQNRKADIILSEKCLQKHVVPFCAFYRVLHVVCGHTCMKEKCTFFPRQELQQNGYWGEESERNRSGKVLKGESSVLATFYCQQYKANMAKILAFSNWGAKYMGLYQITLCTFVNA